MPAIYDFLGDSLLDKRQVVYRPRRNRTSSPGRIPIIAAIVAILVGFLLFFCLFAMISRRRLNRGHRPYYGTSWVLRNGMLSGKKTAMRAKKADLANEGNTANANANSNVSGGHAQGSYGGYGQGQEMNGPYNPTSPPPAHGAINGTYGEQQSGNYYPPPQGPPPGAQGGNDYYPPPQGPPPTYGQK